MSRVVENGQLKSVSPSQIAEFIECPRKWWFTKVAGLKAEQTGSQELGEQIHKQMEDYYRQAVEPSHPSAKAALLLEGVPPRSEAVIIEEPRNYNLGLRAAGIPMRGRVDLRAPPKDGQFLVLDWKTCKTFDYAKSPEELARNPQGIVYLKYGFAEYPDAATGVFGHVYLRTKRGSGARIVSTDPLTRRYVDAIYETLEELVGRMKEAAGHTRPNDVPCNTEACGNYGGCPYQSACPAIKRHNLEALLFGGATHEEAMEKKPEMSALAQSLKARRTPADVNPPDAAKPRPVEPHVAATPPAATPPTPTPPAPTPPAAAPVAVGEPSPASSDKPIEVLFVDCEPETTGAAPVTRIEHEIAARTPELLALLRERYPRDVPDDAVDLSQVEFGKGLSALRASFKRYPPPGEVVVRSNGMSVAIAEVLAPLAKRVIRAHR